MNPNCLMTQSLSASPHGESVTRILSAALEAVDPAKAVERNFRRKNDKLSIGNHVYNLNHFKRVFVIGFGKASVPMGKIVTKILGEFLNQEVLITKGQVPNHNLQASIIEGAHPVPDQRSVAGAQKVVDLLSTTTGDDLVIFLISGGGSALLTLPTPGISLQDIQSLTELLLGCGATINEINCLRKHLSQVKGGQLVRWAAPAQVATLILSDVINDPLDVIASGPTVPDPTTYLEALTILDKYGIETKSPESIKNHLKRGANGKIPETPKDGDRLFARVNNLVIGNNYLAAKAAIQQALVEGFNTLLLTTALQGEARFVGQMLATILRQISLTEEPIPRPACIISGGETTVTVRGNGQGGRNQEVALAAVKELAGLSDVMMVTLATDGNDGPTDAAGAVVTGQTLEDANRLGLDPIKFLAQNASYQFFEPLGDLLKIGLTQTNVNDLTFLLAF